MLLSGESEVELVFPSGYLDDAIEGKVMLVNDSKAAAAIADIKTSCGCTSAIPIEQSIAADNKNVLLIDYHPKTVGKSRVEAVLTFGEKQFHLSGIAETKPRLVQATPGVTFTRDGHAKVRIKKLTPTPVDRLIVFPSSIKVEDFLDGEEFVQATLLRDPDRFHDHLSISPAIEDRSYSAMQFGAAYKGSVEALPRRLFITGEKQSFYLRGDVEPLAKMTQMKMTSEGKVLFVPCEASLQNGVLKVQVEDAFEIGEHKFAVEVDGFTFPLTVIKR